MDKTNIESLISIFKELTTELPQEMIYRVSGDCIELKSMDSFRETPGLDPADKSWRIISSQMYGAA